MSRDVVVLAFSVAGIAHFYAHHLCSFLILQKTFLLKQIFTSPPIFKKEKRALRGSGVLGFWGQLGHQWRQQFDMWREMLARLQAACEALIDFPDDDLPKDLLASNAQALKKLSEEAQALENRSALAQSLHQGLEILIVGPPNAGKSTLLNALAGYERAIVTAHPGTTRDFVELNLQLGPFQVTFVDTAGLRETKDVVEQQGVTRTKDRFKSAALILNLFDPNQTPQKIAATCPIWPVQTKGWIEKKRSIAAGDVGQAGVENLLIEILDFLQETYGSILNDISFQRERQLFHVKQFSKSLQEAQDLSLLPEMQAENLRQAASALAHLSGKIHVEEVLDELFSGFCIGK